MLLLGNREYSLQLMTKSDSYICDLKLPKGDFKGDIYNVRYNEKVNGEKSLSFSLPMYLQSSIGKNGFIPNHIWEEIQNEQKIRLEFIHTGEIFEFILYDFTETRDGLTKIADCVCQDLAVHELSRLGWSITYDPELITTKEKEDLAIEPNDILTADYWLRLLFYYNTKLGKITDQQEYDWLADALSLKDSDGYIIEQKVLTSQEKAKYYNPIGWTWEFKTEYKDDPTKNGKLYEEPAPVDYREYPNGWEALAWGKVIGTPDSTKTLIPFLEEGAPAGYVYVTDEKKRLMSIERSNIYNIIQEICERFEMYALFEFSYDSSGKISGKKIIFAQNIYDKYSDFKIEFGTNLLNIDRTVSTEGLVTKLYVPPIESQAISGEYISIANSPSNLSKEMYLLAFDYYFKNGDLTTGKLDPTSDEYAINRFMESMRSYNDKIIAIQNKLSPLYDQRTDLASDIEFQQAKIDAYRESVAEIHKKIEGLSPDEVFISAWNITDLKTPDYIGEFKSVGQKDNRNYFKFVKTGCLGAKSVTVDYIDSNGVAQQLTELYTPNYYNKASWDGKSTVSNSDFTSMNNSNFEIEYYDDPDLSDFMTGIYINNISALPKSGNANLRYKYSPIGFYNAQIKSLTKKFDIDLADMDKLRAQMAALQAQIDALELELEKLRKAKQEEMHLFELRYSMYIKEGSWKDESYQTYTRLQKSPPITFTETMLLAKDEPEDFSDEQKYKFFIPIPNNLDLSTLKIEYPQTISLVNDLDYVIRYGMNSGTRTLLCLFNLTSVTNGMTNASFVYVTANSVTGVPIYNNTQVRVMETTAANPFIIKRNAFINNENMIYSTLKLFKTINDEELEVFTDYDYEQYRRGIRANGSVIPEGNTDPASYYKIIVEIELKDNNTTVDTNGLTPSFYYTYEEDITLKFLFNDAWATLKRSSIPDVDYSVSVVDLSTIYPDSNFDPILGMIIPIYDEEMGFDGQEGIITEIDYDLDDPRNVDIVIRSYRDKFDSMFDRINVTVEDIHYYEGSIWNAKDAFTATGVLQPSVFQQSLDENGLNVELGSRNDVIINNNGDGITLIDRTGDFPANETPAIRLNGRGIFLTQAYDMANPSQSPWFTGITGAGINASRIVTGSLDTKQVTIWNASEDAARFLWNENGLYAYGLNLDGTTDYQSYVKLSQDGLDFIKKIGAIEESIVSLGWGGLYIGAQTGALQLTGELGVQVYDASNNERIQLGRLYNGTIATNLYGLRIRGSGSNIAMQTDSTGRLWVQDQITLGGTMDPTTGIVSNTRAGISGLTGATQYRFWSGNPSPASATFSVRDDGWLHSTAGDIGGWYITTQGLFSAATPASSRVGLAPSGVLKTVTNPSGTGSSNRQLVMWAGAAANPAFWVDINGDARLGSSGGSIVYIGQWTVDNTGLYNPSTGDRIYPSNYSGNKWGDLNSSNSSGNSTYGGKVGGASDYLTFSGTGFYGGINFYIGNTQRGFWTYDTFHIGMGSSTGKIIIGSSNAGINYTASTISMQYNIGSGNTIQMSPTQFLMIAGTGTGNAVTLNGDSASGLYAGSFLGNGLVLTDRGSVSDVRIKKEISTIKSDFIYEIDTLQFKYNMFDITRNLIEESYKINETEKNRESSDNKQKSKWTKKNRKDVKEKIEKALEFDSVVHYGVSAQNLLEIGEKYGINFNETKLVNYNQKNDIYSVNYLEFIAPMISCIQDQNKRIIQLEEKLKGA